MSTDPREPTLPPNGTPTPEIAPIPEDRVAGILKRAAELDRERRETISVDALRAAALDAGISPMALDAALAEYAASGELAESAVAREESARNGSRWARVRGFMRRLAGPLKLTAAMFGLGLIGALGDGAAAILGWAAWLAVSGWLIRRYRPARRARGFVLRLVLATIGLGFGFVAVELDEDMVAGLFAVGAAVLVGGVLAIKVRLPKRWRSPGRELEAPAG